MPKLNDEVPEKWKPYLFHRINLEWSNGGNEAVADCLFCGRESKLSVNKKTGLYQCFPCQASGNITKFLKELHKVSIEQTEDYTELAESRNLLFPETLAVWEVCQSVIDKTWMVPGYGVKGGVTQLYRYRRIKGKHRLLATPTINHGLHGIYEENKKTIYLCEGPWDAMILWECISKTDMLDDVCVLATPGCNVFQDSWIPLFEGRAVKIMFDNDHPREHNGKKIEPAGFSGARKISRKLSSSSTPPASIEFLQWGPEGYNPDLPNNHDLGDYLCQS